MEGRAPQAHPGAERCTPGRTTGSQEWLSRRGVGPQGPTDPDRDRHPPAPGKRTLTEGFAAVGGAPVPAGAGHGAAPPGKRTLVELFGPRELPATASATGQLPAPLGAQMSRSFGTD